MKFRPASFQLHSFTLLLSFVAVSLVFSSLCVAGGYEYPVTKSRHEQPGKEAEFYTIQAGSYAGPQSAHSLYQNLAEALEETQRSYLRVEKVGNFYTVRLGKFEDRAGAGELLDAAEDHLPSAAILQAYIKDERILALYDQIPETGLALETEQAAAYIEQEQPLSAEVSLAEEAAPDHEVTVDKAGQLSEFYTIQAGSYAGPQSAHSLYQDLAETLEEHERFYLRVEKVGNYYTVRLGKFEDRAGAEELLDAAEDHLPSAAILQAYIKDERILALYDQVPEPGLALKTEQAAAYIEQEQPLSAEPPPVEEVIPDAEARVAAEKVPERDVPSVMEETEQEDSAAAEGERPQVAVIAEVVQEADSAPIPDSDEVQTDQADEEELETATRSRFEKLGQPAGLYPVRKVAVLDKDLFGDNYRYPSKIHYDPIMDEIYVIGGGPGRHPSSRILIYDPDYYPVTGLGEGRGVNTPRGLDLDDAGNIYIVDNRCREMGPCLYVLNPAFFQEDEVLFSDIEGVPEKFMPSSVAINEQYIFVTGEFTKGVMVLDRNFSFVRWLVPMTIGGTREEIGDDVTHPKAQIVNDVEIDQNGRIYLLCPDQGRVFVLDSQMKFLFAFGRKGGSTGKLSRPRSVAVDTVRQVIYVADYMRHTILLYTYAEGKHLFEVGGLGLDPGWFRNPTHVEVDGQSNLIVADFFNHRVQVLLVP
jgi:DNA-binding beta-propeller fold protein YncE